MYTCIHTYCVIDRMLCIQGYMDAVSSHSFEAQCFKAGFSNP